MEPTPHTPYDEVEALIFEIELLLATCEIVRTQDWQRKAKTAPSPTGAKRPALRGQANHQSDHHANRQTQSHRFFG